MENRYGVIYSFTNLSNDKRYIGRTLYPEHRLKTHLLRIKNGLNTHLFYNDYRANPDNFKFEILEDNIQEYLLNEKEKFYIKLYHSCENGYNATIGGDCHCPNKFSNERNKKISDSIKKENHPNYGKHRVYNDPQDKTKGYRYK